MSEPDDPRFHLATLDAKTLPKVRAEPIVDNPRPHLIGYEEDSPPIGGRIGPCPVCGSPNGNAHVVVMMGEDETLARLAIGPTASLEDLAAELMRQAALKDQPR